MLRRLVPRHHRARLAKRAAAASGRAAAPLMRVGALTQHLLNRYCVGEGVEVGPGTNPYVARSVKVDRHASYLGDRVMTDVVADALWLPFRSASKDFVVSAHCLEHQHDALGSLREWARVIRPGGHLVLVLPHRDRTFDRGRPASGLKELRVVEGTDLDPDDPVNWADFERWSLSVPHEWMGEADAGEPGRWNRRWLVEHGLVHYHAWTQAEMVEVVAEVARPVAVLEELPERTDSFAVVGRVG